MESELGTENQVELNSGGGAQLLANEDWWWQSTETHFERCFGRDMEMCHGMRGTRKNSEATQIPHTVGFGASITGLARLCVCSRKLCNRRLVGYSHYIRSTDRTTVNTAIDSAACGSCAQARFQCDDNSPTGSKIADPIIIVTDHNWPISCHPTHLVRIHRPWQPQTIDPPDIIY